MVTPPFDPTLALGSVWCVTTTGLAVPEALRAVGAVDVTELPDGTERASRRLADASAVREGAVLVLARPVEPGRTLLLELESALGWRGGDPGVMAELAAAGTGRACSITKDPNRTSVLFAEDNGVTGSLDAVTGLVHGSPGAYLSAALSGAAEGWASGQRAAHVLRAVTGVRLDADMWSGPWWGGLSRGLV
ncbi:hypothetical protein [Streptomyces griseorubiginosus]|uniref:hypothetical protein n=1 Tax=Streptomyces griseorubiginosus TaxID=67304 RepID=UPI002E82001A|nr:hypothetical protein [Streptomyces griseorubiginosus]WUB46893.1 hypothetical protein OHN19_27605 [Streptomyces griseorubiginosus]WUB55415.1 hypothetical protein OG942_27610 [Streptomyces griseorubiginosus]